MFIIKILNNNLNLLEKFITQKHPTQFRYFSSRNMDVVKNHKLTIIGIIEDEPIAYGHIDHDNEINWIGICVLDIYQNNGYGKQILSYLLNYIKSSNINNVRLSVDIDNYKALNLYLKNDFQISETTNKYYIMKYNPYIELPVSMGEALDKLTILDIKIKKIKDDRRFDVEKEYDLLNSKLIEHKNKHIFYYNILLSINESIWDMQDQFRDSNNPKEQNNLCIQIIKENDNRFRVKKKINNISNSSLKEQKGYNPKTAFILTHLGLGDNITSIGAVRYLATCYDKVFVVCKERNKKNLEFFYDDDLTIELYPVENDNNISPRFGFNYNEFKKITNGMDLYIAGMHCLTRQHNPFTDLPFNFYRDMGINEKYFKEYFHINTPTDSMTLYNKLKAINQYIFIHNSASNGAAFTIEYIENKFNIDRHKMLIINPNYNIYNNNDEYFNTANEFLNKPLAFYIDTINNANKVVMTDSSFFCLAAILPIKTSECYLISRENRNYSHLNSKFIQL